MSDAPRHDDLDARLDAELGEARAPAAAPRPAEEPPLGPGPMFKVAVAMMLFGSAIVALLLGSGSDTDPFVYSRLVHEVVGDPEAVGQELRVEGDLVEGSILFREEPCEWRFRITKEGEEMPVAFPQCVVPDTFRDGFGISVVVQGALGEDGTFLASQIVPRCPSKYEMKERLEAGEEMPEGYEQMREQLPALPEPS